MLNHIQIRASNSGRVKGVPVILPTAKSLPIISNHNSRPEQRQLVGQYRAMPTFRIGHLPGENMGSVFYFCARVYLSKLLKSLWSAEVSETVSANPWRSTVDQISL